MKSSTSPASGWAGKGALTSARRSARTWWRSAIRRRGASTAVLGHAERTGTRNRASNKPSPKTFFSDYRKMFDAMTGCQIDAIVATPDNHHVPASMMAIQRRQARLLREAADARHLRGPAAHPRSPAAQGGHADGQSGPGRGRLCRLLCEYIWVGAIGHVTGGPRVDRPAGDCELRDRGFCDMLVLYIFSRPVPTEMSRASHSAHYQIQRTAASSRPCAPAAPAGPVEQRSLASRRIPAQAHSGLGPGRLWQDHARCRMAKRCPPAGHLADVGRPRQRSIAFAGLFDRKRCSGWMPVLVDLSKRCSSHLSYLQSKTCSLR